MEEHPPGNLEKLYLQDSENTPAVTLDPSSGKFEIAGRSLPDNAPGFYKPVIAWLERYVRNPNPTTELVLRLEYINTGSSKMLLDIFFTLHRAPGAHVSWYFLEDDEDMEETGEEFAELAGLPFELKAY